MHGLLWAAVVVVWFFAWRVQPEPMGPRFNFAKRFLSRIDAMISTPLDAFSAAAALKIAQWFSTDLGLTYVALFGVLILLAGTLQWLMVGRLVQWVAARYGPVGAVVISGVVHLQPVGRPDRL